MLTTLKRMIKQGEDFNPLRTDVESLAEKGSRKVGSLGHAHAQQYLIQRIQQLDLMPYHGSYVHPYQVDESHYANIACRLPGHDSEKPAILLFAHYDTCGDQPGADDNAAAMAIWLEVMSKLAPGQLDRDVILVFPDAEEPPHFLSQHMGSTNFYNHQLREPIHAGLVLDLVGHDVSIRDLQNLIFVFGAESNSAWASLLAKDTLMQNLRPIATLNRYVGDLSDHHILRENGIPYLFFTCGRWEHYHQATDTPEKLNYLKMEHISIMLQKLIRDLDQMEFAKRSHDYDPIDLEIALLRRSIGFYLDQHGISINTREDMQKFVLDWVKHYDL